MAGYLLHFPGQRGGDELLARHGLQQLQGGSSPDWWEGLGPDGKPGMCCGWSVGFEDGPTPEPVERTWQPLPGNEALGRAEGHVWLALEVARPLVPKNIARKAFAPGGQFVTLADGRDWYVPIAAHFPQRWGHDRSGKRTRTVRAEYASLYERSQQYYQALVQTLERMQPGAGGELQVTWEDGVEFCADALALNYRVNEEILGLLGTLDDSAGARLISVVICKEDITDYALKKKEASLQIPVSCAP